MDRPMRSLQIGFGPAVQQQKSLAVQISKLNRDGQITERRIHTYLFDDVKERCCGLGAYTASRSSPQFTPHFTITSIHKGHYQLALTSRETATLLLQSGALLSPHKMHALQASDAWADLSDTTATTSSSFLFLVFLALFLRKIRDLQQRFATDAPHHLSY